MRAHAAGSRRAGAALALAAAAALTAMPTRGVAAPRSGPAFDPAALFRRARASVVQVTCDRARGTGLLWERSDRVLTARHLVTCDGGPAVTTSSGRRLAARVLRHSARLDLAQLALDHAAHAQPLPRATAPLSVGDRVCAIGHPFPNLPPREDGTPQLAHSLTCGRVSNRRTAEIITDAAVNPGVSGAPLFDREGGVVGVVTQRLRGADNIARARDLLAVDLLLAEAPGGAPTAPGPRLRVVGGYALGAALGNGGLRHGPRVSAGLALWRLEVGLLAGLTFSASSGATPTVGVASKDLELAAHVALRPRIGTLARRALTAVIGLQAGGVARFASESLLVLSDEDACPELQPLRCLAGHRTSRALDTRGKALLRPLIGVGLDRVTLALQLDVLFPAPELALGGALRIELW